MEQNAGSQKIAVVGGGVAGIAAAHVLARTQRVTLFEQAQYLGGHTNTITITDGPDAGVAVDIRIQDYREIIGEYDRVVSIEMIEAVGRKNLSTFFDVVARALKPGGRFMLEAISSDTLTFGTERGMDQFFLWLVTHIFPNGFLPRLDELIAPCRSLFALGDVLSFGPDYDRTLMCWADNFDRHWPRLAAHYNEIFRRRWRYYLLGCAALFRMRKVQLYQIVYDKVG